MEPWDDRMLHWARWIAISVVGFTVLLVGLVMVVTPGPAIVVIPLGLAILAVEFAWARRLLKRIRDKVQSYSSHKEDTEPADRPDTDS